jgi:hypothetical protein
MFDIWAGAGRTPWLQRLGDFGSQLNLDLKLGLHVVESPKLIEGKKLNE